MRADGKNGSVEFDDEFLILRHNKDGLTRFNMGTQGDRKIFLSEITSVQLQEGGFILTGYIRFGFRGGTDRPYGVLEATKDPNAVLFHRSANRLFANFKVNIEKAISIARTRQVKGQAPTSTADELEKLARLRDQNVISEVEFQQQKRKILSQ
jgi:hypothetical protein